MAAREVRKTPAPHPQAQALMGSFEAAAAEAWKERDARELSIAALDRVYQEEIAPVVSALKAEIETQYPKITLHVEPHIEQSAEPFKGFGEVKSVTFSMTHESAPDDRVILGWFSLLRTQHGLGWPTPSLSFHGNEGGKAPVEIIAPGGAVISGTAALIEKFQTRIREQVREQLTTGIFTGRIKDTLAGLPPAAAEQPGAPSIYENREPADLNSRFIQLYDALLLLVIRLNEENKGRLLFRINDEPEVKNPKWFVDSYHGTKLTNLMCIEAFRPGQEEVTREIFYMGTRTGGMNQLFWMGFRGIPGEKDFTIEQNAVSAYAAWHNEPELRVPTISDDDIKWAIKQSGDNLFSTLRVHFKPRRGNFLQFDV